VRSVSILSCLIGFPLTLAAQSPALKAAAASITEADVRRGIGIIADDSMGGRDTPSRGLDLTARWVADQFRRFKLKPAGDSGDYLQRYPINVSEPDADSMFIEFKSTGGQRFKVLLQRDVALIGAGRPPSTLTTLPVTLVGAIVDSASLATNIKDHLVLYAGDWSKGPPARWQQILGGLHQAGARGVVMVVNNDSLMGGVTSARIEPTVSLGPPSPTAIRPGGSFFIGVVREALLTKEVPTAADELSRLRNTTSPAVTPELDWSATVIAKIREPRAAWLPNTVGILEGTDPVLKQEYIVVSGHMDHVGTRCRGATPADTICNGADDDGSGTVGVVEVAEALSQPGAAPKRSVIFLTVSAEERGLWGSQYFANHPPVDVKSIVADLNMDMIGRNWKDSVVAIGMQHSDLGAMAEQVAAQHPELRMRVIDDQWPSENLYGRSDHYNFAVKGIPILFFTSGLHADYHAVTDSPDKIDAEKEERILRLVFYLAEEIGNRAERPRWNPESYKKIVTGR
jgi:hypothetical protein